MEQSHKTTSSVGQTGLRTPRWKKDRVFIVITSRGGEKTLKLPAPKQHFFFFFLASATDSQQSGDFVQGARSWKLNFGLRNGKSTLRVANTKQTSYDRDKGGTRQEIGTGPWKRRRSPGRLDPRLVSRCRHTESMIGADNCAGTATRHLVQITVDKTWTSYRPSPSRRHVNFQRCAFQTKLEGGLRAECAASGLGNAARARLSILRTIMNNKNKRKCRPSVRTYGRALCCERGVRSGELRLRSSVRNVRRKLDGPPRGGSATLPTTHLCLPRDTPPGICFLLLLFYRKSHWEMMRRLSSRSAALLFRRALVSWLTAHPVCARRRSCSALSAHGCCCLGCKLGGNFFFKKGGSTMTSSRWATWALHALPENVLIRRACHRPQNNMNARRTATRSLPTWRWKGRKLSLNKIWKSRNGCARCLSASLRLSPFNWLSNLSTSVRQKQDKADWCQ